MPEFTCMLCQLVKVQQPGVLCRGCYLQVRAPWMSLKTLDELRARFTHCEVCSQPLDDLGLCRNRNCVAFSNVSTDWI